jgi:hypothetical protein
MAQTRAQSRALGAPLKFVVKLAGYEGTPAEEMDGVNGAAPAAVAPALPFGPVKDDDETLASATALIRRIAGDIDAERFIVAMSAHFDGLPDACVTMLRGLARYLGDAAATTEGEAS